MLRERLSVKRERIPDRRNAAAADPAEVERVEGSYRRRSPTDFMMFLHGLTIPSASGPQAFEDCIKPFQSQAFELLGESLTALRAGRKPPRRRFWIERTKKAGKDSDLAICLLWLMAFPTRPMKCQVVACDSEQAGIVVDRAVELLHYNPWLNDHVEIVQRIIRNKQEPRKIWAKIEASDTKGGAHGQTPELLILNELTHSNTVWRAMEDHMNNADGVPHGVVIISTNAGIKGTKAETWKKNAAAHPDRWTILEWKGKAPWVSDEDVLDAKRRDPVGAEFARLWLGKWVSGLGGAVEEASIDQCFVLDGPLSKPEPGWTYVAGLDLGISHDHAGIVVLGANQKEQRIKVARVYGYQPTLLNDNNKREVDLQLVEKACGQLAAQFHIEWFGYDPAAGGSFMAQRLRGRNVPMREVSFSSPKNLDDMATSFVQCVQSAKLECYEDPEGRLRRDFGKFQIQVKARGGGYRLVATSDDWGHADAGTALVVCLPEAVRRAGVSFVNDSDVVIYEEFDAMAEPDPDMPSELQEICDMYDDESMRRREPRSSGAALSFG